MVKIVANWKMYLSVQESRHIAAVIAEFYAKNSHKDMELTFCPSDLALWDVASQIEDSGIFLGAQNLSNSPSLGPFTSQTAASQLKEAGVREVIIGHSEVRQFFGETDEVVGQKVQVAVEQGLNPIICIGETKEMREAGAADGFVATQISSIFHDQPIPPNLVIAYEPRWAISSVSHGSTCSPEDAAHMHQVIEHALHELTEKEIVDTIRIMYGGSVDAENIVSYLEQPRIDGVLIGSASSKEEKFLEVLHIVRNHLS